MTRGESPIKSIPRPEYKDGGKNRYFEEYRKAVNENPILVDKAFVMDQGVELNIDGQAFRVGEKIGKGGQGKVYRLFDLSKPEKKLTVKVAFFSGKEYESIKRVYYEAFFYGALNRGKITGEDVPMMRKVNNERVKNQIKKSGITNYAQIERELELYDKAIKLLMRYNDNPEVQELLLAGFSPRFQPGILKLMKGHFSTQDVVGGLMAGQEFDKTIKEQVVARFEKVASALVDMAPIDQALLFEIHKMRIPIDIIQERLNINTGKASTLEDAPDFVGERIFTSFWINNNLIEFYRPDIIFHYKQNNDAGVLNMRPGQYGEIVTTINRIIRDKGISWDSIGPKVMQKTLTAFILGKTGTDDEVSSLLLDRFNEEKDTLKPLLKPFVSFSDSSDNDMRGLIIIMEDDRGLVDCKTVGLESASSEIPSFPFRDSSDSDYESDELENSVETYSTRLFLDDLIKIEKFAKQEVFIFEEKLLTAISMLRIVYLLHQRKIAHLDLKPESFSADVADSSDVHIIDFGLADHHPLNLHINDDRVVGTPEYMPPEAFQWGAEDLFPRDIYSVGKTLCELFGHLYFKTPGKSSSNSDQVVFKAKQDFYSGNKKRKKIHYDVTPMIKHYARQQMTAETELWQTIDRMISSDPSHRPTAEQALNKLYDIYGMFLKSQNSEKKD